jgi:predicted amidohydrolase YtcJ
MKRLIPLTSIAGFLLAVAIVRPALAQEIADKIFLGGPILTMDGTAPRAEAIAVKDGRVLAVGTDAEVMEHKGDGTETVNLGGKALLPGFVDAHGHMFLGGMQALSANLLAPPDGEVSDIAKLQQTLRDWAEKNQDIVKSANLILGFGYDNAQLKEQRHPTREDLDEVSTDVPVVVIHQSAHLASLNSKALEIVGYDASTKDPEGGVIQRQEGSQEPNGVLEEVAWGAALPKLTTNIGPEGGKMMIMAGSKLWAKYGYTTAQEGRAVPSQAELIRAVSPSILMCSLIATTSKPIQAGTMTTTSGSRARSSPSTDRRRDLPRYATAPITIRLATTHPAMPAMRPRQTNRSSTRLTGRLPTIFKL